MTNSTLIIAEAGVNHNGELDRAIRMIDLAAEAGADLIKFQTFVTEHNISRQAPKADYQKKQGDSAETQFEMVKKLELSRDDHISLLSHCRQRGIGFFSTAFDADSVELLEELGSPRFKIPSGEITNLPHLRHIGAFGKPILLSTGMASLDEVGSALDVLERAGTPKSRITVLHCNTEYPTPMVDVNLRAMLAIKSAFGVEVGYSDHTMGIEVPVAAVALGASVIEKHFTLDRDLPGPDHQASLEPDELAAMVSAIRNIELAMGDGIKRPSPSEWKNIEIVRKSIVAKRAIEIGEVLGPSNLSVKRPGTGISPMRWDEVVGSFAKRAYAPDDLIEP